MAAVLLGAAGSLCLAGQLRHGIDVGLWERAWLVLNTGMLLGLCGLAGSREAGTLGSAARGRPRLSPAQVGARLTLAALLAFVVLLLTAMALQPAFDLRHDLASNLGAHGARLPGVGRATIVALGVAHLAVGLPLLALRLRAAAAFAAAAGVCAIGIALVPMTCPRGAHGCSGPDSGRAWPRPTADTVHRDLVAVFEFAAVLCAVAVVVHLLRSRRVWSTVGLSGLAVASPALLLAQQGGTDIGWWQLSWITVVCATLLAVLVAIRTPRPAPDYGGHGPEVFRPPEVLPGGVVEVGDEVSVRMRVDG